MLVLFIEVCSTVSLGCDATRCCVDDDIDVVELATVADDIVTAAVVMVAVVMVTADDGTEELGAAASAAAMLASRRLRINPTRTINKCYMQSRKTKFIHSVIFHHRKLCTL